MQNAVFLIVMKLLTSSKFTLLPFIPLAEIRKLILRTLLIFSYEIISFHQKLCDYSLI